nr:TIGR00730 family Rossman fold protein [uncultured Blautia sp.]
MNICVYGAASPDLEQSYYDQARQLGRMMGQRGHGLVFGGGNTGLMGAVARGVSEENGYILGIAPGFFNTPGVLYQKCTEFIMPETMRERKQLLEERSQATIVVPGGIGTYEEFFEILTLKSLGRIDRPIVLYNMNGYFDLMRSFLEHTAKEKFMTKDILKLCRFMEDPKEILDYIQDYGKGV